MPDSGSPKEKTTEFHTIDESVASNLKDRKPDEVELGELEQKIKGLGNITRLKILWYLGERDLCVHDLSALLNLSQSAVSHQLKQLKTKGFVDRRKEGRVVFYSINQEALKDVSNTLEAIL